VKILLVTQHFYPENFRINSVAASLVKHGFKVDVLTGMPNYPSGKCFAGYESSWLKSDSYQDVQVFRVPIFFRGSSSNVRLILNYLSFVISASFFGLFFLRKKYDLVFCYATSPILQAIPAILLAKKNSAPFVLNVQDLWPESISATGRIHSSSIIWCLTKLVEWIYRQSNLILTQSNEFHLPIKKLAPVAKILFWPNSVDPSFYRSDLNKMPEDLDSVYCADYFTVTFAGNIGSAQSIETIVEASNLLKMEGKIRIILLGDGSKRQWALEEKSKNNLKNLFIPGFFPEKMMPIIYSKSSCLLVTLTDRYIFSLTIPNKIQGYLALGRPIIGSINGAGAEVIKNANAGMVSAAENSIMLAEKILEMSKLSRDELSNFGKNGRDYFMQHFEHEMLMQKLTSTFNGLVKQ
jgi:glycosyltransferase involved in cell wall biosynthesis